MRVLLVAYYFPPDGGAGTQRPTSFARYLPDHGVACTVLTRSPPDRRSYYEPADAELLQKVEGRSRIARTPKVQGGVVPWLPGALGLGQALIEEARPDVILVTMSPFELWQIGASLGDRFGVPVVFDLRDPWALDGVMSYRSWLHWRREFAQMRAMLRRADGVIANTPECRSLFLGAEPALRPDRVAVIPNGWDHDDFRPPMSPVPVADVLRLVFTGSFLCRPLYERESLRRRLGAMLRYSPEPIDPSSRTPLHLLRAMRLLRSRGEPAGDAITLVSIGAKDSWLERCVQESGVLDAVEITGYRSHRDTVQAMRQADALFLTLHGLPKGHRSRIVPGKTYEYLATGRPILGALPEGDARSIVEASGRGYCADPCDDEALAATLIRLHRDWLAGKLVESVQGPTVASYERSHLAGELAAFLRATVAARSNE